MSSNYDPLAEIEAALIEDVENTATHKTLSEWVSQFRTLKGKPWQWVAHEKPPMGREIVKDFRFLIDIYDDNADQIVIKKSRQMAVSEFGINWIMGTVTTVPYTTAVHIFPNQDQAKKFSMVRLTPVFDRKDSPKLARYLVDPDQIYKQSSALHAAANVYHKQFTNHSNYILSFVGGSNTKSTDARSVSADILFFDESKDLPEEKIADVMECMSQSAIRKMRMVGTPDLEGTVFDNKYLDSDRREWVISCKECGSQQIITMDNIYPVDAAPSQEIRDRGSLYYYACIDCMEELDRSCEYGKWISQNPGASVHGYHISQLMASWITADEIMQKKAENAKYPYKFANEVLGETYTGGEKPITVSKLINCKVTPGEILGTFKYVTIGVDWGNHSHYVVMGANNSKARYLLEYGIWSDIQIRDHAFNLVELATVYAPDLMILDSGYGKAQNQYVFQACPGKAYGCFYKESAFHPEWKIIDTTTDEFGEAEIPLKKEDWQYHVTCNHTALCDSLEHEINNAILKIPIEENDNLTPGLSPVREYMDNLTLARVVTSERGGVNKRRWIITKAHNYAATAYANMAMDHLISNYGETTNDAEGSPGFFAPRAY
ncbi:phage terminase large subunit family protein [uncultured Methanolobus sp.]|uniref:phage terminase large subunit family protein n=1 Tax=uncultured Methanolobus sp. TaxID=218300 RepID=UPI002AABB703|nr:phage terminase large subunit family protein [uncultured Methanolobus sp.]